MWGNVRCLYERTIIAWFHKLLNYSPFFQVRNIDMIAFKGQQYNSKVEFLACSQYEIRARFKYLMEFHILLRLDLRMVDISTVFSKRELLEWTKICYL